MTYEELKQEEYAYRMYEYLKSFLAVHEQVPIKVIRIDNYKKSKILIIKQAQRGLKSITTRQCDIPLEDAPFFIGWLAKDFPSVELEYINSR